MAQFDIPKSPSRNILSIDTFLGVDFTNSPISVDVRKTPNGQNMIRDVPGKVRKSMGYKRIAEFQERLNGIHIRRGDSKHIVHAGTKLYYTDYSEPTEAIYEAANDERSVSWQFGDSLYIADGKALLVFDGESVKPVSEVAKIPLFSIARAPAGGGTQYENLNLLQPGFQESFLGEAGVTQYHLSFGDLDATPVKAEKLDSGGTWKTLTENTDFTVDRAAGIVTFTNAPGVSPVSGEDNVRITAYRTVEGYADRINKCKFGTLFGVNGAADRLFISGNPDFINYDWFSGQNDPTYFADTSYAVLGTEHSAVIGYSIVNDRLATHKDDMEDGRNVIIREGNLVDNQPAFPVVNTLQGEGAVAPHSFAYLLTEPLFLTKLGVYAITPQDITGERYAQSRSFFVDEKLKNEQHLENAVAVTYKDMYWLFINGVVYILDGLQYTTTKDAPYSTRQYICFYRINVPARIAFTSDDSLWFGSENGVLYKFYEDPQSTASYNDDGAPIEAVWDTPELSGNLFYKNKTFRFLAVQLSSAVATGVSIYEKKRGIWTLIKSDESSARYFDWGHIDWERFSWSNDETPQTVSTKLRVKRVDKAMFRFENKTLNEPFGLVNVAFEFVESGNYKG